MSAPSTCPLLEVERLVVTISRHGKPVCNVVKEVSFNVPAGAMLALVGESGSGKTMIGRSILNLLPGAASVSGGDIRLAGQSLIGLPPAQLRKVRGGEVGMVFQEPMVSLNPALRIGVQMREALQLHRGMRGKEARTSCLDMLARVGIRDPEGSFDAYPAQFSGGMLQRIMLASVLATRPRLLIADEPTGQLDAETGLSVMALLRAVVESEGVTALVSTHDPVMMALADRVIRINDGRLDRPDAP